MHTNAGIRFIVSLVIPLSAQTEDLLQVTVKTAKPCLEFTRKLQDTLHWRITFEDPLLLDKRELLPVVDDNGTSRNALRVYSSTLRVSTKDHRLGTGKDRLMKELLRDCHNSTSLARFKFTRDGDFVHVTPTHVRTASGEFIEYQALLETPVTIPMGTYLMESFVNEVLSQVRRSRGVGIAKGPLINNLFLQQSVTQSATSEPARDVLVRAFREVEDRQRANGNILRLTWYFGYSHNWDSYFFNVGGAHPEDSGSEDSLVKNPVRCFDQVLREVAKQSQFAHFCNLEEWPSQHIAQLNLPSFHSLAETQQSALTTPMRLLIQEDKLLASNFPKY